MIINVFYKISHLGDELVFKEEMKWLPTSDVDPRGVSIGGYVGKFLWATAIHPSRQIPAIMDGAYWDYYNLPRITNFISEITEAQYDAAIAQTQQDVQDLIDSMG